MVDVFIIGGGPGGYVAAIKAAQLGMSVGLAEQADMGGTCTNWGCIPTKTMLASSKLLTRMQKARAFGIAADNVTADFAAIMARKDQVVVRLRKGIEYLMKKNKVQVYASRATLRDPTHVCIDATGEIVEARSVIIATGSSPVRLLTPASGPATTCSATQSNQENWSSSEAVSSVSKWRRFLPLSAPG
jgi:dihydrolipoamide dehydrogenase